MLALPKIALLPDNRFLFDPHFHISKRNGVMMNKTDWEEGTLKNWLVGCLLSSINPSEAYSQLSYQPMFFH